MRQLAGQGGLSAGERVDKGCSGLKDLQGRHVPGGCRQGTRLGRVGSRHLGGKVSVTGSHESLRAGDTGA